MLYVSEGGEATVVRIQSIQMVADGGKRFPPEYFPRRWGLRECLPPFDRIMGSAKLEVVVGNLVIYGGHLASDASGASPVSALALALHVLHLMGWTTPRDSPWKL